MIKPNTRNIALKPEGDLTVTSATELRQYLKEQVDSGIREVVIDMANVKFVDSIGISVLFATHNTLKKIGGTFSVINISTDIEKLFRRVGLTMHFSITPVQ